MQTQEIQHYLCPANSYPEKNVQNGFMPKLLFLSIAPSQLFDSEELHTYSYRSGAFSSHYLFQTVS